MKKHIKLILLILIIFIFTSYFVISNLRRPVKVNKDFNNVVISYNHKDVKSYKNLRIDVQHYK